MQEIGKSRNLEDQIKGMNSMKFIKNQLVLKHKRSHMQGLWQIYYYKKTKQEEWYLLKEETDKNMMSKRVQKRQN